jgi:hypothetical protein
MMRTPGFDAETTLPSGAGWVARRAGVTIDIGAVTVCDCVPACRVVTICIFGLCGQTTICDDCAYVRNCRVEAR